jgi:hypothetical protein
MPTCQQVQGINDHSNVENSCQSLAMEHNLEAVGTQGNPHVAKSSMLGSHARLSNAITVQEQQFGMFGASVEQPF